MRRQDREITDHAALLDILRRNTVCRLALHDNPYPYVVPLNYGITADEQGVSLYFHCAREGEKLRLMQQNPMATFEVDTGHALVGQGDVACQYSYGYESVIGHGRLSALEGKARRTGLLALMHAFLPNRTFSFDERSLDSVVVLRLDVQGMTGKQNIPKA